MLKFVQWHEEIVSALKETLELEMNHCVLAATLILLSAQLGCDEKFDLTGYESIDLTIGSGVAVEKNDTVYVRYTGMFTNGRLFDRSPLNGDTNRYFLGAKTLIPGWRIGIVGMKPGGKRRLVIPPHLAYGERGKGQKIPPNATLIFEIELVKIH